MYAYSYIKTAAVIIDGYTGGEPFPHHLRSFFAQHKKYGSRDRKHIIHLCYCYFRLGKALEALPLTERITKALFLCSEESNAMLEQLDAALNSNTGLPFEEKMRLAGDEHLWKQVFPLPQHISQHIDAEQLTLAHFMQPYLYLRIRPGYENEIKNTVEEQQIPATFITSNTLQLPNSIDASKTFVLNKTVVVQDLSSQQTGELFRKTLPLTKEKKLNVLDACAASGGKTMKLYDLLKGEGQYTVNDVRRSIMHNLQERFKEADINNYYAVASDITANDVFEKGSFDIIIADVPCSGSGTWGRSPEHLRFFPEEKLNEYITLQKNITSNLPALLRSGGLLFYITCSVYAAENENNVQFLQNEYGLQLLHEQYFKGYLNKADTMYGAVLMYQ